MVVLPSAVTEEAFAAISRDEAALRPGVERLCRQLGVDTSRLARFAAGSRPVYAAGDLVLKLFPPVAEWPGRRVEAGVLAAVQGGLPIPAPRVHAAGEHDGWGYVLMSRLPGIPLDTVWDQVPTRDRDRLADQLGETIAALHQVPPPHVDNWWPADWPAFVARQRAQCVTEQRALGLPAAWTDQIPGFLDAVALPSGPPVLLHTEVMRQHLLAAQGQGGAWRLSGLIDFEPAMRGEHEYEFVAVGCSPPQVMPGSWPAR
jgi:hygromycin-B 7''-O-kinase